MDGVPEGSVVGQILVSQQYIFFYFCIFTLNLVFHFSVKDIRYEAYITCHMGATNLVFHLDDTIYDMHDEILQD